MTVYLFFSFPDEYSRGQNPGPVESGSALGPDWHRGIELRGAEQVGHCVCVCVCCATLRVFNTRLFLTYLFTFSVSVQVSRRVSVEYQCEVEHIFTSEEFLVSSKQSPEPDTGGNSSYFSNSSFTSPLFLFSSLPLRSPPTPRFSALPAGSWPVYVQLTNGKTFGCDLVVSATGVVPNTEPFLHGNNVRKHFGRISKSCLKTDQNDLKKVFFFLFLFSKNPCIELGLLNHIFDIYFHPRTLIIITIIINQIIIIIRCYRQSGFLSPPLSPSSFHWQTTAAFK